METYIYICVYIYVCVCVCVYTNSFVTYTNIPGEIETK